MDALTTDSGILDSAFLGAVTPQEHERSWTVDLDLNGKKILDTGAEVTAISEESLGKLKNISLRKPAKLLYGPTCNVLEVIGQFVATLKTDERVSKQSIFVVRGLKSNLLGLPAITALQLINWISATQIDGASIEKKYPEYFSGLGNLGEPYVIKMKKDAVPYSLFTPIGMYPFHSGVNSKRSSFEWKQLESYRRSTSLRHGVRGWWSFLKTPEL